MMGIPVWLVLGNWSLSDSLLMIFTCMKSMANTIAIVHYQFFGSYPKINYKHNYYTYVHAYLLWGTNHCSYKCYRLVLLFW